MTSFGLSSTFDVITFDQTWHHLYSTSVGGKDLSSDAQIRVSGLIESEINTATFPPTTRGWSTVKIARLDEASLEVFQLQASPVEG